MYNYNEVASPTEEYSSGMPSYSEMYLGDMYKTTQKSGLIPSDSVVGSLKSPSYNYGSTYGDLTVGMSYTEFNSASLGLSMWGVTVEGKSNIVASGGNSSTIESWNNSTSYTQKNIFIEYKTGYLDNFGEASWSLYHTSTVSRGRKNITTTNTGDYIVTYSPAINSSFSFSPTNNRFSVNINGYITIAVSNEGLHGSFEMGGDMV